MEMNAFMDEINSNSTVTELKLLKETIIDITKHIKSNDATFQISTLPKVSEKLTEYMEDYIEAVQKIETYQRAFSKIHEDIDNLDEECNDGEEVTVTHEQYLDPNDYSKRFEDIVANEYNNGMTNEIDAQLELEKIIRPPEEDVQIEAPPTGQIPKDPITKKNITIAVKSTVCNHVYDQDGIEEYFKQKEQGRTNSRAKIIIQCPQAGCTNKSMSRNELVLDEETNKLIQSLSR